VNSSCSICYSLRLNWILNFFLLLLGAGLYSEGATFGQEAAGCYEFLRKDEKLQKWPLGTEIKFKFENVPESWKRPIREAAKAWNNVLEEAGIPLKFKEEPNFAENIIKSGQCPQAEAQACGGPIKVKSIGDFFYIERAVMIINPHDPWSLSDSQKGSIDLRIDLQGAVMHEFGHWLGLADLPASKLTCMGKSVMRYPLWPFSKLKIGKGDIEGLKALYLQNPYPSDADQARTKVVVSPGTYSDWGSEGDRACLAIEANVKQRISIELTGPRGTDFDLWVYKPGSTFASWGSVSNTSQERIVIDSAPETGRYVICISFASGSGVWSLAIKVESSVSPTSQTLNLQFPLPPDKLWVVNTYPNHHWGAQKGEWEYAADFYYADNQNDPESCSFENAGGVDTPIYAAHGGKLRVQVRDAVKDVKNFDAKYRYYFVVKVVNEPLETWYIHLDLKKDGEGYGDVNAPKVLLNKIKERLANKNEEVSINKEYELGWVNAGDIIGYLDRLGQARLPHLHFEVKLNGKPVSLDSKGPIRLNGEVILDSEFRCKNLSRRFIPMLRKKSRTRLSSAIALVMDVSGSMGWTWQGEVKLESAKRVASQTISLIEGEARASGAGHSLAIVSFSDQANLLLPLTTDYRRAKGVVLTLSPQASTNLGAGLQMALAELAKAPAGSQKYITLLSDGHITSGMSEGEVLAGPVAQARQRKICIHTVGFGDPNYLKEDFLKMISQQSGCGKYLYAKNAFELTNAYIKLRHLSLGGSIAEFISQAKIYEGETLTLGVVSLPGPRAGQEIEELHFTLTWSGSRLQPRLFDPAGVEVTEGYPGAQITYFEQFAHVAVRQPQPGFWKVVIFGEEVPPQGSDFYAVLSTRPGKLATIIPVINPVICFKYPSGEERCRYLLQGNIPTWRIIIGNIATLAVLAVIVAVVIYLRLSGQIP
jgi:Mg-chelatase subunit ChlD